MNDVLDPLDPFDIPVEVDIRALSGRTSPASGPVPSRWRVRLVRVAVAALVGVVAGGGLWWERAVAAGPGLEFYGGPNVYRDAAATDLSGISRRENVLGDEVDVDFRPDGRLFASFGLVNNGHHDVRIVAAPPERMYYWAFETMSVGSDPDRGLVGFDSHYRPFRPFTLHVGQTVEVRLEYRTADCDPAGLQSGSSSVRRLPLRYRILGVTRTADVPFRDAALSLQTIGICTHPLSR